MEENNRKGPGVFYAVVGVATLVVAIIGATFAYFSASDTDSGITGETADASNLELTVEKLTTQTAGLIPMLDEDLGKGITGENSKNCVDANGNSVCNVYQIALKNGKSPVQIAGDIKFVSTARNIVYSVLGSDLAETKTLAELATTAGTGTTGKAFGTPTTLDTNTAYAAEETKYYYVAVWLHETGGAQEDDDANKKTYTGTVTFNAANGGGVTATFSS